MAGADMMNAGKIELPFSALKADEGLDGAFLDSSLLEDEMRRYNGNVDFSYLSQCSSFDKDMMDRFLPMRSGERIPDSKYRKVFDLKDVESIIDRYSGHTGPCSLRIDSIEELAEHMLSAYVTSHFYYIYGKTRNIKGTFPQNCCGVSSRSVMLSMMYNGNPAATSVYSTKDHFYGHIPFVMNDIEGTIIVEPTWDQMSKEGIRNKVSVRLGSRWEHIAVWGGVRHDFFPDYVVNHEVLKKLQCTVFDDTFDFCSRTKEKFYGNTQGYLEMAYANPVKIKMDEQVMLK